VGIGCPDAKLMMPLLLIESPVSAGEPIPEAKSKFNLPDAVERPGLTAQLASGIAGSPLPCR